MGSAYWGFCIHFFVNYQLVEPEVTHSDALSNESAFLQNIVRTHIGEGYPQPIWENASLCVTASLSLLSRNEL